MPFPMSALRPARPPRCPRLAAAPLPTWCALRSLIYPFPEIPDPFSLCGNIRNLPKSCNYQGSGISEIVQLITELPAKAEELPFEFDDQWPQQPFRTYPTSQRLHVPVPEPIDSGDFPCEGWGRTSRRRTSPPRRIPKLILPGRQIEKQVGVKGPPPALAIPHFPFSPAKTEQVREIPGLPKSPAPPPTPAAVPGDFPSKVPKSDCKIYHVWTLHGTYRRPTDWFEQMATSPN